MSFSIFSRMHQGLQYEKSIEYSWGQADFFLYLQRGVCCHEASAECIRESSSLGHTGSMAPVYPLLLTEIPAR